MRMCNQLPSKVCCQCYDGRISFLNFGYSGQIFNHKIVISTYSKLELLLQVDIYTYIVAAEMSIVTA